MSKTLKIFLFSLFGAVLGVFALGAASNIGRDDKKDEETVAEEVTLETFQDPTKYTEVAAQQGDLVAGNWYRVYEGNEFYIDDWANEGCYFQCPAAAELTEGDFDTVVFYYRGSQETVENYTFTGKVYASGGIQNAGGAYMDIYIECCVFTVADVEYAIADGSIVSNSMNPVGVYQLVPNA
ncbi:MAG: hypothetical protein IJB97_05775 [Clostridia bacterium]|nr:hypothetical protein [Clostridia bacterium]